MLEIFYQGFAFVILWSDSFKNYYSEITLESDRKFHFWQYDRRGADTWQECLFDTIKSCEDIITDYGFAPIGFNPVEWDIDPNWLDYF